MMLILRAPRFRRLSKQILKKPYRIAETTQFRTIDPLKSVLLHPLIWLPSFRSRGIKPGTEVQKPLLGFIPQGQNTRPTGVFLHFIRRNTLFWTKFSPKSRTLIVIDSIFYPSQLIRRESRLYKYTIKFNSQEIYYSAYNIFKVINLQAQLAINSIKIVIISLYINLQQEYSKKIIEVIQYL